MVKIVTFWSGKGGVGKSSLAKNFAAYLSLYDGKRVLVIDKDPQRSTYKHFSSREDSPFTVVDVVPMSFDGFDFVVCDLPPLTENSENPLSVDQLRIIECSDLIVCPFYPDEITVDSVLSVYSANTNAVIKPVLNRFRTVSKLHNEALSKVAGCLKLKDRTGAYETLKASQVLFDRMRSTRALSDARAEFKDLAKSLLEVLR